MADKDYLFYHRFTSNQPYRMILSDLLLNGYDAFLLSVDTRGDYDTYLAAHRISDGQWYEFDPLGSKKGTVPYTDISAASLNATMDYMKNNDIPLIREQHMIYKIREDRMRYENPGKKL